ncbi:MAG: GNAT family N-acetyltransferase [Halanaerobiales bacterium]
MINIKYSMPEDINKLIQLQQKYTEKYPDYIIRGKDVFSSHPVFQEGKNIICVYSDSKLTGFASVFPEIRNEKKTEEVVSNKIWFDIIVNPEASEKEKIKKLLLEEVKKRALNLKEFTPDRIELAVCKFSSELSCIRFYKNNGFKHKETNLLMLRSLSKKSETLKFSGNEKNNLKIKLCQLKSAEWKEKYLNARNSAFKNSSVDMVDLNWFLAGMQEGSALIALHKGKVIGGGFIYSVDKDIGVIEDVFTIPQWRRKGIATKIIRYALGYAKSIKLSGIELEVLKENKKAVNLYKNLGFKVIKEEIELTKGIKNNK